MQRSVGVLMALVAALLAGCSSGGDDAAAPAGPTDAGFPVTIDSALGPATLADRPERVVTIGWGSQDAALALGVVPVGMQDMSEDTDDGNGVLPWDRARLGGASPTLLPYSSADVPFEAIAALDPDVILAVNSGVTPEQYETLSKIAPTVGYPGRPWLTSWQDQLRIVGVALGRQAQADRLRRSTEERLARVRSEHPEFAGKKVAFGAGVEAGTYNVYTAGDSRVQLLRELGFDASPSLPGSAPSYSVPFGLEQVGSIDADVLVSWYATEDIRTRLESDPLFRRSPAVARHGYVRLQSPSLRHATTAVTVLSLPWMLDRYVPMLSAAVNGRGS